MRADTVILALLLVTIAGEAKAQSLLSPRAVVSYESRDTGLSSSSYLREEVEVTMSRMLSDALALRFQLGATHSDSEVLFDEGRTTDARILELRPSGTLFFDYGPVSAEGEYSLRDASLDDGREQRSTANEVVRLDTAWQPVRFLPAGTFRASRYRLTDDRFSESLINDSLHALLTKSWGGLSVSGGGNLRVSRDDRNGFERTTADQTGSLAYNGAWLENRVIFSTSASGTVTDIEDTAGGRTSRIPNFQPVSRAFWVIDDTPLESFDRPLISVPALIDNRLEVLTSISLGPESGSFQTIAFDLGGISSIDQIEVVVRDDRQEFVLNPAGVLWDVYTSLDGERWEPHTFGLETSFNVARSQYEISFERVDVRWIKVVSFGVAAQPLFVTEARALFFTELTGETRDSAYESYMINTSLGFVPHRLVRLGYSGSGWFTTQEIGADLRAENQDLDHQLQANWDLHPRLGVHARAQLRDSSTNTFEESSLSYLLGLRLVPLQRLQLNVFCEQRQDELLEGRVEAVLCSGSASAQIFPTLDLIAGVSQRDEDHLDAGGTLSTEALHLTVAARLTPALRLNLSGTSSRSDRTGELSTFLPSSRDDRVSADLDYRAGSALGLGASLGWVEGEAASGVTQRYRVRWNPFGNGAITLTTSYNQDIDPYSDSRSKRILISPRWQINAVTALTLGYSRVELEGEQMFESESLNASMSLFR